MRDYILLAIIIGSLPFCFFRPYIGILVWVWFGLMNPHRLTWGVAYEFPSAQLIAAAILIGFLFSRDKGPFPRER